MKLLKKGIIIWITSCHFFANFDGGKTKKMLYVRKKKQKPKNKTKDQTFIFLIDTKDAQRPFAPSVQKKLGSK